MEHTIKILKKEIESQEPIRENKFFTISKELKEITEAMNRLLEDESSGGTRTTVLQPTVVTSTGQTIPAANISAQVQLLSGTPPATTPQNAAPVPTPAQTPLPAQEPSTQPLTTPQEAQALPASQTQPQEPATPATPTATVVQNQTTNPVAADSAPAKGGKLPKIKFRIPKPVAIFGMTILLMGAIGGFIWYTFNKKPQVNAQLVQQYLPDGVQIPSPSANPKEEKKINESGNGNQQNKQSPPPQAAQPKVQGASDTKYAESQADVPFDETVWDTFKDPTLGVEMKYPKNSVNVVKTESSLTFLRKNGYIFKIQVYETALDAQEYWKSVKANNLNYTAKEITFREQPALFLELEDITNYPGDRYLIKKGEFIYDIWYATFSKNLSEDDVKRVDIILNSFAFLN